MSVTGSDVRMAVTSVRSTRWRSLLTTSGIIIGICSVVTIVGIGEGIKHQVATQINQLGKDLITIRPGNVTAQGASNNLASLNLFGDSNYASGSLGSSDERVVQNTPHVAVSSPMSLVPGPVKIGNQTISNVLVMGTSSTVPQLLNQTIDYGNFFGGATGGDPDVAVLGASAAQTLFPGQVPLGQSFTIDGQQFMVRGEFNQFDIAPLSLDANFNNVIFIPYSTAQALENNTAPIYEILAKPSTSSETNSVASAIENRLQQAHGGVRNFSVLKQQDSLSVTNNILNLLTKLISGIAAVSLLVGGIGIMNIMLVSVTERTHEIGIRKALGATNRQILNQFMVEAVILSLLGGLLGVISSLVVNVVLRVLTSLEPAISWEIIVLATGVSLIIGIIFGIVPAIKAARKNPIDALRYYQ